MKHEIEELENALKEYRDETEHLWLQIIDKEESASRWLGILIVLGLMQLYPFESDSSKVQFLIMSLPSFVIAFFATALTLVKHPNYLKTHFFVPESNDKKIIYVKNKAEQGILKEVYHSLNKNYEGKKKTFAYIGPSIVVNFTVSLFFLICFYILGLEICVVQSLLLASASILIIFVLKNVWSRGSFSRTFSVNKHGEQIKPLKKETDLEKSEESY